MIGGSPRTDEDWIRWSIGWTGRMRQFFDTWDYDLICQHDIDKLHEHLSLALRLHGIRDEDGKPARSSS